MNQKFSFKIELMYCTSRRKKSNIMTINSQRKKNKNCKSIN